MAQTRRSRLIFLCRCRIVHYRFGKSDGRARTAAGICRPARHSASYTCPGAHSDFNGRRRGDRSHRRLDCNAARLFFANDGANRRHRSGSCRNSARRLCAGHRQKLCCKLPESGAHCDESTQRFWQSCSCKIRPVRKIRQSTRGFDCSGPRLCPYVGRVAAPAAEGPIHLSQKDGEFA